MHVCVSDVPCDLSIIISGLTHTQLCVGHIPVTVGELPGQPRPLTTV